MVFRSWSRVLGFATAVLATGCSFFFPPEREYLSNDAVLAATSAACGFNVDTDSHKLTALDVREDAVTFQYDGIRFVGDHSWVVRFSEKSTEQDPIALTDVYSLLPLLKEGKTGFEIVEDGAREVAGSPSRFIRYRFDSPVRNGAGKPLPAHGIVASLRATKNGRPLVYQLKLDNHGDREDVGWEDLAPFIDAMGLE